jgi:hypothetical protein
MIAILCGWPCGRPSGNHHQGLGNPLIVEEEPHARSEGAVRCRQRLGGMLNYY